MTIKQQLARWATGDNAGMRATVSIIIAICAANNFVVPILLDGFARTEFFFASLFFFNGLIAGQVILLATWAAFGEGKPVVRFSFTLCVLLLLQAANCTGLLILNRQLTGLILHAAIQFVIFIAVQMPLWVLRGFRGIRFYAPCAPGEFLTKEPSQFGLLSLLGLITLASATLGILRFAAGVVFAGTRFTTTDVAVCLGIFISIIFAFTGIVVLPAIWLVIATRRRVFAGLVLMSTAAVGPFALLLLYSTLSGGRVAALLYYSAFPASSVAGLLMMMCGGLVILRCYGYRLLSHADLKRIAAEAQPDLASS